MSGDVSHNDSTKGSLGSVSFSGCAGVPGCARVRWGCLTSPPSPPSPCDACGWCGCYARTVACCIVGHGPQSWSLLAACTVIHSTIMYCTYVRSHSLLLHCHPRPYNSHRQHLRTENVSALDTGEISHLGTKSSLGDVRSLHTSPASFTRPISTIISIKNQAQRRNKSCASVKGPCRPTSLSP